MVACSLGCERAAWMRLDCWLSDEEDRMGMGVDGSEVKFSQCSLFHEDDVGISLGGGREWSVWVEKNEENEQSQI